MIGQTVSHYKIVAHLGSGGMGEVYLAEDTRLGRRVAIKFIGVAHARDRISNIRFRNEAQAAAQLSHPSITTLHDFDADHDPPFLVMEYLEGQSLRERIAQGPLPIDEVLRVGKALAAGLSEAHGHGVVHRDIKSANVMLTAKGEVKILDFGLAKRTDVTEITVAGSVMGTVAYMSPEQSRGEAADFRGDLWGVGVVLYEALTGRLPFRGDSFESVVHQIQTVEPLPPTGLRTGIPLELESAVLRCLEKHSSLRLQTADDLLAQLSSIELRISGSGGRGVASPLASTSSGGEQVSDPGKSTRAQARRARWLLPAMVVVLAIALSSWWATRTGQESDLRPVAVTLAVGAFAASSQGDGVAGPFGILVHMGLLQSEHDVWVLDPQWIEHQRQALAAESELQEPSELAVARAARATHVLHGNVDRSEAPSVAHCLILEIATGRTTAAWTSTAATVQQLASSVAQRALQELLPSSATDIALKSESIGTSNSEAWLIFRRAEEYRARGENDLYREELLRAVALDSTFALAAYDYAMTAEHPEFPEDKEIEIADLAWRHRDRLDMQRRLLVEARRLEFAGELHRSADVLREAHSRWPEDLDTAIALINYLRYWQHVPESTTVAAKTLLFFPESIDARWVYAGGLAFSGNLKQATQEYERVLAREIEEFGPESEDAAWMRSDLVRLAIARGDLDRAEKLVEGRERIGGESSWDKLDRAEINYVRGDLAQALIKYEALGADDPEHAGFEGFFHSPFAWIGYGFLLGEAGRDREYLALFGALELARDGRLEWILRRRLRRAGRQDLLAERVEASGSPESFLSFYSPIVSRALELQESVWLAIGRGDDLAARDSVEALTDHVHTPGVPGGWIGAQLALRADVALAEGRPEVALLELRAWEQRGWYRGSAVAELEYRDRLVRALRAAGRRVEAIAALEDLLSIYGGHVRAHLELGRIHRELGQTQPARLAYERFLDAWKGADADHPVLLAAKEEYAELIAGEEESIDR